MAYDINFGNTHRDRLIALRDHLEDRINAGVSSRDLAPTAKQYVEVCEKIEAIPNPKGVSEVVNIMGNTGPRVLSRKRAPEIQSVS